MEKTYYTNGKVTVTDSRFIVPDQTYAMSGITSVKFETSKPSRTRPIVTILGGLFIASRMPEATIWVHMAFIAPGALWLALQRTKYSVTVASASGEGKALTSKNAKFIRGVIDAINQAIVDRG